MNLEGLLEGTRFIVDDRVEPYQWSSAILTDYLNEAVDLFARRTYCLLDDSQGITTAADVTRYELDPSVIAVIAVRDSNGHPLSPVWSTASNTPSTGFPRHYTARPGPASLLIWPTPDDAYDLQVLVARRPESAMTAASDEPEIPEQFHRSLCDYAAYRAWLLADPDGENQKAAMAAQARWDLQLRDAKREYYQLTTMGSTPYVLRRGR